MKKKQLRHEHGAAVVEFALIAVLLFTIIFAIIEFGILLFDKHVLTNASREGARAGVVMRAPRVSDTEIENIVKDYAEEHMVTFDTPKTLAITISPDEPTRNDPALSPFGTELIVSVQYPFDFMFLSNLGLPTIELVD